MSEEFLTEDVDWVDIDAGLDLGSSGESLTLYPEPEEKNTRLDKFVANHAPGMSRSWLQRLIEDGNVLVDGQVRSRTFKVTPGQVIEVAIPPVEPDELVPEVIPLDVVYEDADIIAINKAAGMVVHPAPGTDPARWSMRFSITRRISRWPDRSGRVSCTVWTGRRPD